MQFGVSLSDYDEMTPAEMNMYIESVSERLKLESDERMQIAYMTAYWHRVENLKPYHEEVKREEKEETQEQNRMSNLDMFLKINELNSKMGGNVEKEE